MTDKRIFKRHEIESNRLGWVVDLSGDGPIKPDCYWYFKTRKAAVVFLSLVETGMRAEQAACEATESYASGTKPDTSLFLGDKRKQWLVDQGGIQPTIQRLIDDVMGK